MLQANAQSYYTLYHGVVVKVQCQLQTAILSRINKYFDRWIELLENYTEKKVNQKYGIFDSQTIYSIRFTIV